MTRVVANKSYMLYVQFKTDNYNQTPQDGKPACTNPALKVTTTPPPLSHVINICGFIYHSTKFIITKLGGMLVQHAITLEVIMMSS